MKIFPDMGSARAAAKHAQDELLEPSIAAFASLVQTRADAMLVGADPSRAPRRRGDRNIARLGGQRQSLPFSPSPTCKERQLLAPIVVATPGSSTFNCDPNPSALKDFSRSSRLWVK